MDEFGDRMKLYERAECARRFMPLLPIVMRIDGKCFSGLTKNLDRPFDALFSETMQFVTQSLVAETGAKIGYTQSDEITLVYGTDDIKTQVFFDGKIQKMVSVLASMATAYFNSKDHPKIDRLGTFDCRAWNMPSKVEAANAVLWRESDAVKNSISMAARSVCSHKELFKKTSNEMQEMLFQRGVNWNDYPTAFRRGTYFQRRVISKKFSLKELDMLPPMHEARSNPDLEIDRTEYRPLDMPIFSKVRNRVGVVFDGEDPVVDQ